MRDPLRTASTEIRRIVSQALAEGATEDVVVSRVTQYLSDAGIDQELTNWFLEAAAAQFGWITDRTLSGQALADLTNILETIGAEFALVGGEVQQNVVQEIVDGIRSGRASTELEDILQRKFNHGRAQARTVVNTSLLGLARSDRMAKSELAGIQRFRYVGPSPDRPFCRDHYRKVYTREEINRLSNGQISPVRLYCGGYNCRHQWAPVD